MLDLVVRKCQRFSCSNSGTTGLPKAVVLTHRNFIPQYALVCEANQLPFEVRRLISLPVVHVAIASAVHTSPMGCTYPTYILPGYDSTSYLRSIATKYKIGNLTVVPPVILLRINSPLIHKYCLQSVRRMLCGAAPLEEGPQPRMQAFLRNGRPFTQLWDITGEPGAITRFRS